MKYKNVLKEANNTKMSRGEETSNVYIYLCIFIL